MNNLKIELQNFLSNLIEQNKYKLNNIKQITIDEAWKILQLAIVEVIQSIEIYYPEYAGKDKKVLAMNLLTSFYDGVFVVVNVPFVPSVFQPIIHKYVKMLLLLLASSSIDALVTIFRNIGFFKKISPTVNN